MCQAINLIQIFFLVVNSIPNDMIHDSDTDERNIEKLSYGFAAYNLILFLLVKWSPKKFTLLVKWLTIIGSLVAH